MDMKKMIAVLAVVIITVSGVAVWFSLTPSGEEPITDYGGKLQVYGNANGDSVIDENDTL